MSQASIKDPKDKWILICFVAFFGVIIMVNSVFIYSAITSQPGVITKNAYEKGIAFNEVLQKAKSQPKIVNETYFQSGVLTWVLPIDIADEQGVITAKIIRPVQAGYDFDVTLKHVGEGHYEAKLPLPFKGQWIAHLKAEWSNTSFQTTHTFIAH